MRLPTKTSGGWIKNFKTKQVVMNLRNRDLLVLTKKESMNQAELEHEIELLNSLFYLVESSNTVWLANEVIDINRYKIIGKLRMVRKILSEPIMKPFVFISNKN
jgi:hypothetical protein